MPSLIVTGAGGQLGTELLRVGPPPGVTMTGLPRAALDIADTAAVTTAVREADVVINTAAYTKVDLAEREPGRAFRANARGPWLLARACARRGIPLIHVSTDYVFDGVGDRPWREDDPVAPLNVYGDSKAAGEDAVRRALDDHVIVRTGWLYADRGTNFVTTLLAAGRTGAELSVVDDQHGTPTAAVDVAATLMTIAARLLSGDRTAFGTYHYSAAGSTTWFGFAEALFERVARLEGRRPSLRPVPSADRPTPARRPAYSVLDCDKIMAVFAPPRRPWRDALDDVLGGVCPDQGAARRRSA